MDVLNTTSAAEHTSEVGVPEGNRERAGVPDMDAGMLARRSAASFFLLAEALRSCCVTNGVRRRYTPPDTVGLLRTCNSRSAVANWVFRRSTMPLRCSMADMSCCTSAPGVDDCDDGSDGSCTMCEMR